MLYNRYQLTHRVRNGSLKGIGFGFFGSGLRGWLGALPPQLKPIPDIKISDPKAIAFFNERCTMFGLSEQACNSKRASLDPRWPLIDGLRNAGLVVPEEYTSAQRFQQRCAKAGVKREDCMSWTIEEIGIGSKNKPTKPKCKTFYSSSNNITDYDACADYYGYPKLEIVLAVQQEYKAIEDTATGKAAIAKTTKEQAPSYAKSKWAIAQSAWEGVAKAAKEGKYTIDVIKQTVEVAIAYENDAKKGWDPAWIPQYNQIENNAKARRDDAKTIKDTVPTENTDAKNKWETAEKAWNTVATSAKDRTASLIELQNAVTGAGVLESKAREVWGGPPPPPPPPPPPVVVTPEPVTPPPPVVAVGPTLVRERRPRLTHVTTPRPVTTPETPVTPPVPEPTTPTTASIFGMSRKTLILGGSLVGGAVVLALILKKRKQTQQQNLEEMNPRFRR